MTENIGPNVEDDRSKEHVTQQDTTSPSRENLQLPNGKNISLCSYLYTELTRGYYLENDEAKFAEKRQRVYTFMKIPRELEKFMTYGFFQCVDAFLYMFTFLPVRFFMAVLKFCIKGCIHTCFSRSGAVLEPAEICDLLKGSILIICVTCMSYVDVSMMYHIIRGQAIIKLYIFFNMLEVADRLFSSFGQDILDSLFWTATEPRGRRREHVGVIPHLILAVLIVFLHAILVLFQATTLNVAFNSHNKALLTIMMSNNFVELKGSVFKKFEKKNLFQMSCSDVRERFHFLMLLAIVCMRNLTEFSWNMELRAHVFTKYTAETLEQHTLLDIKERFYLVILMVVVCVRNLDESDWNGHHFWVLVPDVCMVMVSEFLVDWVKHAFITKFNEIPAEVYSEYTVSLAYDMAASRQKKAFSDHLDVVSRRMGLIPLPLAVLLIRIIRQSVKISTNMDILLVFIFYLCLTSFKVLNSIVLLGKACDYIKESKDNSNKESKPSPMSPMRDIATSPTRPSHKRQSSDNTVKTAATVEKEKSGEDEEIAANARRMNRSQSVGAKMNVTFSEESVISSGDSYLENGGSAADDDEAERSDFLLSTQGSLTPKALMSNSMVSLESMCMNEEYVRDKEGGDLSPGSGGGGGSGTLSQSSEETDLRQRKLDKGEGDNTKTKKCDEEKLGDVDRFSMCSNRII